MFRDSLIPVEAIRLAALGLLAEAERHYGELAAEIRHFTSHVAGPSLDLMGTSLELLRYEGLIEPVDGKGMADNAVMRLTPQGRSALHSLLQARLRVPLGDANRLTLLLKLRFLEQLPEAERQDQRREIAESLESERTRLTDLRRHHAAAAPRSFLDWLDRDIATLGRHLDAIR